MIVSLQIQQIFDCRSIDETVQSFVTDTASSLFFGDGGFAEADRLNKEAEEAKKERR